MQAWGNPRIRFVDPLFSYRSEIRASRPAHPHRVASRFGRRTLPGTSRGADRRSHTPRTRRATSCQSPPPARTAEVEPLAPARFKVQFTASAELRDKLERLTALLRSEVPDGDLAAVIDRAVTEKLERLEARGLALHPDCGAESSRLSFYR